MRTFLVSLLASSCALFAQPTRTLINPTQIRFVAHFASPPVAPTLYTPYLFVDAMAPGVCSGGGIAVSWCAWNGTGYTAIGGASTGLGDPGSNSIPYRNAPGATVPAIASDFPILNQNTAGTASNITGILARANGGLNGSIAGTGFLRDGTTPAAGELSGDCTTSGSFVVACHNVGNIDAGVLGTGYGGTGVGFTAFLPAPNTVFMGVPSGSPGLPTFRLLQVPDIPVLPYAQIAGDLGNFAASPWVISTHLSVGLPRTQGGFGNVSAGSGILRDGNPPTATELSGDAFTFGSNVVSLAVVNSGPGACGDSSHVCQVTTNGKGLVTAQTPIVITGGSGGNTGNAPQYDVTYYSGSGSNNLLSGAAVAGIVNASAGAAPTAATAHTLEASMVCSDTSGSPTAQVCNTAPYFFPLAGDTVIYSTATANSGSLTVNVNGQGTRFVTKFGGYSLIPFDVAANVPVPMTYDGSTWIITTPARAPVTTAADFGNNLWCHDTSGSATAQVCTTATAFTGSLIQQGATIAYTPTATNTGPLTLNVNGQGPTAVNKNQGSALLSPGDLQAGEIVLLTYNGGAWSMPSYGNGSIATATACASPASPALCAGAPAGAVAIPVGAGPVTLVVHTTAVTAGSSILLTPDASLTLAATTCNSTLATLIGGMAVTARTPGTSFTITYPGTIASQPLCLSFAVIN